MTAELVNTATGEVAAVDPRTASAEELERFAVTARDWLDDMTEDQLDDLESTLVAVAKRLRVLRGKAAEAEASRVMTLRRLGEVIGGSPGKGWRAGLSASEQNDGAASEKTDGPLTQYQLDRRYYARLFANPDLREFVDQEITDGMKKQPPRVSVTRLVKMCQRRRSLRDVPLPDRRYSILLADPPWRYEGAEAGNRQIENQYGTMTLERIKALGEENKIPAADDAVLFLWTTSPKLVEGIAVLKSWGFEYKTSMVWVKDRIGMGYYARQQHELILIGKRGEPPAPKPENRPSSVFHGERLEHSAKPESVYELIESMYPEYERSDDVTDFCELFARNKRPGWQIWGLDTSL